MKKLTVDPSFAGRQSDQGLAALALASSTDPVPRSIAEMIRGKHPDLVPMLESRGTAK